MTRSFTEAEVLALARRAYESGEATFPIRRERSALLVIDMQDELPPGASRGRRRLAGATVEFVRPGWTPFWVPEATRHGAFQEAELKVLRKGFARVMTAEEIVGALRRPPA